MTRRLSDKIVCFIACLLAMVVCVNGPLQSHHHDCDGKICLALPGGDDHHHDKSHHTHSCDDNDAHCPAIQSALKAQSSSTDSHPLPAILTTLRSIFDEQKYAETAPHTITEDKPILFTPPFLTCFEGRKAPPSC